MTAEQAKQAEEFVRLTAERHHLECVRMQAVRDISAVDTCLKDVTNALVKMVGGNRPRVLLSVGEADGSVAVEVTTSGASVVQVERQP